MIRRYTVMLLLLGFASTFTVVAQDLQTRHLRMINSGNISTIVAPSTGGSYNFVLPPSNGTLLIATNPALGTAGVMYSVTGAQDSATPGRWLFNVQYNPAPTLGGATAAGGGRILSNAYLDANATGLTLTAQAGGTSTARGLVASATGGATNYAIEISGGSLKINAIDGLLFGTSGVVSAVTVIPNTVTIPAAQVTGISQYSLAVGGATGLASLATGNSGDILVSGGGGANPTFTNPATALGSSVVLYNQTGAQTTAAANGTAYLFNTSYLGAGNTGAGLGGVITSTPTGAANANATGLTINAVPTGTGVAQGIVVNTAGGADLIINEDAITRAGNIAINTGAGNTLSTNGNVSADGDLTLGTSAVAGGSIVWNDNTAGPSFNGTMQGPLLYTATRTYTLPDADGTFMLSTGALGANRFLYSNASGQVAFTGALSDGMLLIGNGAGAPVAATLSGTRGITITNGAGSITVGMPTGTSNATLRFNGTNWVETGATFTIDGTGNTVTQGDATFGTAGSTSGGQLRLHDEDAGTVFFAMINGPSSLASNQIYNLPAIGGTFLTDANGWATTGNGHTVTDGTNNLIGTTTAAPIRLVTGVGGVTRLTISATGAFTFAGTGGTSNVTMTSLSGATFGAALAANEGIVIADATGLLSKRSVANAIGGSAVLYNQTGAQNTATADGTAYLFNTSYLGAANTGAGLGGVITSTPTGAVNANATGLTINAVPTGTGVAQGIVVNTAAGADLVINEDAITRAGNIAINTGANNTLSSNGASFNLGLGTQTTAGSIVLNDATGGTGNTGTIVTPTNFTANRTFTLPDASGTLALASGSLGANRFVYSDASGAITSTGALSNGQILIGSGAGAPAAATLAGTRGITITNAANSITIGMPTAVTTGSVLRYNGTDWVETGAGFTVDGSGNVTAQGDVTFGTSGSTTGGGLILHDNNAGTLFTATINGPTVLASDQIYTLPAIGGTFLTDANGWATTGNGHTVTDGTNNLIGTTTAAPIRLVTGVGGVTRLTISAAGAFTFAGTGGTSNVTMTSLSGATFGAALAANEGIVIADATGVLSKRSVANVVGSSVVLYNQASAQSSATPVTNSLFNVSYAAGAGNAAGATINSSTTAGTANGLTVTAGGTTTNTGLTVNATTGTTNQGIVVNTGAFTDLVINEDGISRTTGNIALNTGTNNAITSDGAVLQLGVGTQTTVGRITLHDATNGTGNTGSIVAPINFTSNQSYTLPDVTGTLLTDANGWATTGNGHTITDGTNNLLGPTTANPLHLITGGTAAANRRVTITAAGDLQVNYKLVLSPPSIAPTAISGAVGGAVAISTSYVDQSVTPANGSGAAKNITLPAGTNGQVAYLRLSIVNAAGNAAINLVNSDATNIEVFAQGADYERVLHMIYKTGGTAKWVVLSNVAP